MATGSYIYCTNLTSQFSAWFTVLVISRRWRIETPGTLANLPLLPGTFHSYDVNRSRRVALPFRIFSLSSALSGTPSNHFVPGAFSSNG